MFNIDPHNYTSEFKELVSPFHPVFQPQANKCKPQTRPICNCDDDNDDCGMAPECAFVCNMLSRDSHKAHNTTKKRGTHVKKTHTKKIKARIGTETNKQLH